LGQDRLADMGVDLHPKRERDLALAQMPGQPGACPGAVATDQDRLVSGGRWPLLQHQIDQGDQIIGGTGGGVAWSQQAGQRLARGFAPVQVGQQWAEPERLLVGAGGGFFGVAVGQHLGRVRIHDQQSEVGVGTSSPRTGAGVGPGGP
jgi:hypothetical protein